MQPKTHRLISVLLLLALLLTLAAPALAQEPTTAAPAIDAGTQKAACAAFAEAEQQEFDSLTAMKAAENLAGADLARYDALAQQLSCYSAQPAAPVQAEQARGAAVSAAPLAPGVCDTAGPIEVEGTILGTTPTAYGTLGAAFAAINAGTHTGAISIDVCGDTTEPAVVAAASAILNASGSGSASYTSITMAPAGGIGRTISGAATAGFPLVDLNGADNVTVNGLNSGGNALTIANTSTAATSGTSTIRFQADATNNLLTRLTVLGSASMATGIGGGNIWFGSASTTTGNDNNTVSYSNIGPAGANLPSKGIYFSGTSNSDPGTANSGIVIDNNNIYDTFSPTVDSAGIVLSSGSTAVTISNNRFYQTAPRTMTATPVTHYGIGIFNTNGNNYQVTGNTIGFASSAGTGTYTLVFPASSNDRFQPISLLGGATTASSVQGNIIAGIAMSGGSSGTSTGAPFSAIGGVGLANIGTVIGNTIGSQTAVDSITYTSDSSSTSQLNAIYWLGASPVTISNNTIGGITTGNTSTGAAYLFGILAFFGLPTLVAENNTFGGSVADSIFNSSTAAGALTAGIVANGAFSTLTGNTIRNMTAAGGTGLSLTGIRVDVAATTHAIQQNTIHSLRHTAVSGTTYVSGLVFGATAGPNLIARNFIHSLGAASPDAVLNGIYMAAPGATTFQNNMIRLGIAAAGGSLTAGPAINGVFVPDSNFDYRFYFNSVYVGGSGVGGSASTYALNSQNTFGTRDIRNNIFYNARSNDAGTGKHYAVRVGGTAPNPTGLTINNNLYYASGAGGLFGFYNNADVANLAAWKAAVGQDAASLYGDPKFLNPTGTAATVDLHIDPGIATPVEGNGVDIPSVTNDFDGQTRASLTPVDIGADAAALLPLAVTLASFTAQGGVDRVLVAWETVSEMGNAGFNLYRTGSVGDWEPSRRDRPEQGDLIATVPSQAPGSTQGYAYSYDDLAVQPGLTYWYWLEDVSLGGATTLHGPVSATVQAPTAVELSGISASPAASSSAALPWLLATAAACAALALGRRAGAR